MVRRVGCRRHRNGDESAAADKPPTRVHWFAAIAGRQTAGPNQACADDAPAEADASGMCLCGGGGSKDAGEGKRGSARRWQLWSCRHEKLLRLWAARVGFRMTQLDGACSIPVDFGLRVKSKYANYCIVISTDLGGGASGLGAERESMSGSNYDHRRAVRRRASHVIEAAFASFSAEGIVALHAAAAA